MTSSSSKPRNKIGGNTTRITATKVHGFPDKFISDAPINPKVTWRQFFHQNEINWPEDEVRKLIVKSKKASAALNEPIKCILEKYKSKYKISVSVIKPSIHEIRKPKTVRIRERTSDRVSDRNRNIFQFGELLLSSNSNSNMMRQPLNSNGNMPAARKRSNSNDTIPVPGSSRGRDLSEDDLPDRDDLSQCTMFQENNLDDIEDEDLKSTYLERVHLHRPEHFRLMLEEYKKLKASGGNRDMKWRHYAPLMSAFVISGFQEV